MKNPIRQIVVISLAWFSIATLVVPAQAARPNIILIMADDMGFSDLGCYGSEIQTPNLDALAAAGLRFSNYRTTPMCVTTRVSLLSGMAYHTAGSGNLPNGVSFPHLLRDAGYHTSLAGKVHGFDLVIGNTNTDYGFTRFFGHLSGATDSFKGDSTWRLDSQPFTNFGSTFYSTDAITDYATNFIGEALAQNKPFFTWVSFNAPHGRCQAPEADIRKYYDAGIYARGWTQLRQERFARQQASGLVPANWELPGKGVEVPDWSALPATSTQSWALQQNFEALCMSSYAGMVDRLDQNVGRLVAFLRDRGVLDNTLILFCSDNGGAYAGLESSRTAIPWDRNGSGVNTNYGWGMLMNTPFRFYKHSSHEGGTQSPLIAHWPAGITLPAGTTMRQHCNVWDLYPTFLELAGATYPATYRGKTPRSLMGESLVPLFANSNSSAGGKDFISSYQRSRAVLNNDWKAVTYADGPWELYNLTSDPTELKDMSVVRPDILAGLVTQWNNYASANNVAASWNPTPGTQHRGFGFDNIRAALVSTYPLYMSAGVLPDAKLSLTFRGAINFNNTTGKKIRLQRYGSSNILWEADPEPSDPAQGKTSITFTNFPNLEPNTHYSITWDGNWAFYNDNGTIRGIESLDEGAYAFRFKTGAGTTLATWSFAGGSLAPVTLSALATPQPATFMGANSGIITAAAGFNLGDGCVVWSGAQLPSAGSGTQLQTALVADQAMRITAIQYTGYLWSRRTTTNATTVSAEVVAWLNGVLDSPPVVGSMSTLVAGSGGTNLIPFTITYNLTSKVLQPGDKWDLRLRLQDANTNTDALDVEGFGIDSVLVTGSLPP